jgi:hypothetical protein
MDLRELNDLRKSRCKEILITNSYSIHHYLFRIKEIPGYLSRSTWDVRQNSLLKYILENELKFKDKNILILSDGVGFCSLVLGLIGANVSVCEEQEYWFLIETNIKNNDGKIPQFIRPLEYKAQEYDYIIISETIYNQKFLDWIDLTPPITLILGIKKDFWENEKFLTNQTLDHSIFSLFPKDFTRKQVTALKKDQNVIFELEKKKPLWIENKS